MSNAVPTNEAQNGRRWLGLGAIGIAQLMVVLDVTIVNVALPSAQRALHFGTIGRQSSGQVLPADVGTDLR